MSGTATRAGSEAGARRSRRPARIMPHAGPPPRHYMSGRSLSAGRQHQAGAVPPAVPVADRQGLGRGWRMSTLRLCRFARRVLGWPVRALQYVVIDAMISALREASAAARTPGTRSTSPRLSVRGSPRSKGTVHQLRHRGQSDGAVGRPRVHRPGSSAGLPRWLSRRVAELRLGQSPVNAPYDVLMGEYNDAARGAGPDQRAWRRLACVLVEPMLGSGGCLPGTRSS